jgi:hypothetical protein
MEGMKTRSQFQPKHPQGNKETQSARAPGLPQYQPVFPPMAKWTLQDFSDANPETTPLTLRRYLERDMHTASGDARRNSKIIRVKVAAGGERPKESLFQLREAVGSPVLP